MLASPPPQTFSLPHQTITPSLTCALPGFHLGLCLCISHCLTEPPKNSFKVPLLGVPVRPSLSTCEAQYIEITYFQNSSILAFPSSLPWTFTSWHEDANITSFCIPRAHHSAGHELNLTLRRVY